MSQFPPGPFTGQPSDASRRRFVTGLALGGVAAGAGLWRTPALAATPYAQPAAELTGTGDARLFGASASVAYFLWRRGLLGTILAGMAVFLPLRVGLGW